MGIRLEAGKRYVTRSGWITPPMEADPESEYESMKFFCGTNDDKCAVGVHAWSETGRYFKHHEDGADLLAEHVEVAVLPDVPDTDEQLVGNLMFEIGGQFVSSLARAYQFADSSNRQKIRNTFREYWSHYLNLAQQEKAKSNG
jgi:hypothetical protein